MSSTEPPSPRPPERPRPATSPCRWRSGRPSPTATSSCQRIWDSGRVGVTEREKLSSLIWGRLDAAYDTSGLAVSLPEACRLSDALVGQLRVRLGLDVSALETTDRIADLRAQLERIRDQIGLEAPGARQQQAAETQSKLARRLRDVADKAGRGGDVGGLLPPLEIDAARFERDLIVGAAQRRQARAEVDQIRRLRDSLEAREEQLRTLATSCVATVDPAPRYAVPDVDALGPVPNTLDALAAYRHRLVAGGPGPDPGERRLRRRPRSSTPTCSNGSTPII